MRVIYRCENSTEGIFSGVYAAWPLRHEAQRPKLALMEDQDMELFASYEEVAADSRKTGAVIALIRKYLGEEGYEALYQATLAKDMRKADAVLGTVLAALNIPDSRRIMQHLGNEDVRTVFACSKSVGNEAHHLTGFVRFRELRGNVLFSEISPKHHVLPVLAPHFADRFPGENWMITDCRRGLTAVHQAGRQWVLTDMEINRGQLPDATDREEEFVRMWKSFTKSISIRERENLMLQRQNLPLRFRSHLPEFEAENMS